MGKHAAGYDLAHDRLLEVPDLVIPRIVQSPRPVVVTPPHRWTVANDLLLVMGVASAGTAALGLMVH